MLQQGEGNGATALTGDLVNEFKLTIQVIKVGDQLVNALARSAHGAGNANQFLCGRVQGGHGLSLFGSMDHGAGGTEPERACAHGFLHQPAHGVDILLGGGFACCTPFAHDIDTQGAVRHLCAHIHDARTAVKRLQVFRKTFPFPLNTFGQHRSRNILHAFHQVHHPLTLVGP